MIDGETRPSSIRGLLGRASGASLLVKVAGAGLAFLLQVFLARVLGSAAYGEYAFAVTAVALLALPCVFGLDTAALRFVAAYRATGRDELVRGFARRSLQVVALASVAVALAFAILVRSRGDSLRATLGAALLAAVLLLPVTALLRQTGALLQALRRVVLAEIPNLVLRPLLFAGAVWGVWRYAGGTPSTADIILIEGGATLLVLVSSGVLLRRVLPSSVGGETPTETRYWLSVAFPLFLLSGANAVMARTDIVLLGLLDETVDSGFYLAGSKVAGLALMGLVAANMIVAPLIAELHARRAWPDLQDLLTASARGTFAFGLLVSGGLFLLGPRILDLFGSGFRTAYVPMMFLIVGNLANVAFGSVGYVMTMTGHERETAVVIAGAAALNVVLDFALIPSFGMSGAAVASAISGIAWNAALLVRVRRRFDLRPSVAGPRSRRKDRR